MSSARCSRRLLVMLSLLVFLGPIAPTPADDAVPPAGALTSRPRPEPPAVTPLVPGAAVQTKAGERRRLALPDGSTLYLNENTIAELQGPRLLAVTAGEVYLELASGMDKQKPFVVQAGGATLSGGSASFAVRIDKQGPAIGVTRGQVRVQGRDEPLHAGHQLENGAAGTTPRATHRLAWLRDLMCAAEAPLLPANDHAGGALVAIDPQGQEAKLTLRRFHVDVHIEDGFARTTIDQTYFNHHAGQLEGTFFFPLPPDASLSRLAMYVNGQLMEGGMAERQHARNVYETIRFARRDPALLEWVDGSTFKMRVFPLEPRQEKRIILSYSQRLPALYGKATYRFPAGHSLQKVRDWSLHARIKDGAGWVWDCPSHTLQAREEKKDLLLFGSAKDAATNRDIVLNVADPRHSDPADVVVQFATAEHEGARYLMARYRPSLGGKLTGRRRDWTFLVETSGDRDPLLARVQIEVLRHLLGHAEPDDTFTLLAAGTGVKAFSKEPLPMTAANVSAALAFLESAHLIGALDLGQALTEAAEHLQRAAAPHLVHLGSGIAAMGERRDDVLAKRLPQGTTYIGVGVGRRWNRALMKAAAERTGGHFTQINPDEPIAWRAFELLATINTPRLMDIEIRDQAGKASFLAFNQAIAQGEEIAAITRVGVPALAGEAPAKAGTPTMPTAVVVKGTLDGKAFERVLPVKLATLNAGYLPRTWAKLEIERLLAADPVKHKDAITALSKSMYVITPYTSLLVLENEDQYAQYHVDRGRKDHWALYPLAERIPVIVEPDPDDPATQARGKLPAKAVLKTIAVREIPGEKDSAGKQIGNSISFTAGSTENMFLGARIEMGANPAIGRVVIGGRTAVPPRSSSTDYQPAGFGITFGPAPSTGPVGMENHFLSSSFTPMPAATRPTNGLPSLGGTANARGKLALANNTDYVRVLALNPAISGHAAPTHVTGAEAPSLFHSATGSPTNFFLGTLPELNQSENLRQLRVGNRSWRFNESSQPDSGARFADPSKPDRPPMPPELDDLLYKRPMYQPQAEVFNDLLAYAPGLNAMRADVLGVLDAEALPGVWNKPGKIDPAARKLLEKARLPGWQALTLPAEAGQPAFTVHFDSTGRFVYETVLPFGLREHVVCDGQTLTHLYPQLALAARRDASRFHRADLAAMVPWFLPPTDELARGADLQLVGERTVAIVPHGVAGKKDASYQVAQLLFAADGRLAERRVVRMPGGDIVSRLILSGDGTMRLLDGKGQELAVQQGKLVESKAPTLTADTKDLLVLPLPYRTSEHVRKSLKLEKKNDNELTLKEALPVFLAYVAEGNGNAAQRLFSQVFQVREQRQLGFYVLLASCGFNLDSDHLNVLGEHLDAPLAQYLALHTSPVLRKHASQWAVASVSWRDDFLQHLAVTHAILQRWQEPNVLKGDSARVEAEKRRAIDYVRKNHDSLFGWAMLCLIQDRAENDAALHGRLAELWPLFEANAALRFAARYEQAQPGEGRQEGRSEPGLPQAVRGGPQGRGAAGGRRRPAQRAPGRRRLGHADAAVRPPIGGAETPRRGAGAGPAMLGPRRSAARRRIAVDRARRHRRPGGAHGPGIGGVRFPA